jgi:sugar/nucleoside kinase (ribokinase family)
LAPVAAEVEAGLVAAFPQSMVAVTAQGWLRTWDPQGAVAPSAWEGHRDDLGQATLVIASLEDLAGEEHRVDSLAAHCQLLVLTEGDRGVRVYWNGDVRRFAAPPAAPVDPTGAGDIFAAAFICRYFATRDPWESARLAARLATASIGRAGLSGVPTPEEARSALIEVLA